LVFELCSEQGVPCRETIAKREQLAQAKAMFLTSSVYEIRPVTSLDAIPFEVDPTIARLRAAYAQRVLRDCPGPGS
jgi:branched-subunit amino acid aminotransferase/4-amino-4-deoxychorismate lyase